MDDASTQEVRLLLVEDVKADAERTLYHFRRAGVACEALRVETAEGLIAALEQFAPTIILSDFSLPRFDGMSALQICRERAPQVPFVFWSGTIGEERAIAALHAGASDYVLKDNPNRLVPAVLRAIGDAATRRERAQQEAQIARLNRVLRMLKGVNELLIRHHDRAELLRETCRLAISLGGYAMAVASTCSRDSVSVRAVDSDGVDEETTALLRAHLEESARRESSAIGTVLRTSKEYVGNDTCGSGNPRRCEVIMARAGLRSFAMLPLSVDGEPAAVLLLAAREAGMMGEEELGMLRDLAASLSFGLQYVHRDVRARFLSHFNPLTGLAGRSLFCGRVRDRIAGSAAEGGRHAVGIIDVRRLGAINDSFGRAAGDQLLRRIAEALKKHFGEPERLAHFGGGIFAFVLDEERHAPGDWPATLQQRMQVLFGRPFAVENRTIPVGVRVGWALSPDDAAEAAALVQSAEAALHLARAGGEVCARFDSGAQMQSVGNLALEHRLRYALQRNEFELHYQPKVDVVTRRIRGAEALLRWRSPEDGLVSPGVFLPVLEASGLILDVGQWVIAQAARDCRAWHRAGAAPVRIAVNIAPAQLRLPEFESLFLAETAAWATKSRGLDIEITEGVLQEECGAEIRKLERLRAAGVRIAIDDFGTGYSSLSRLSTLPVDTLKVDRSFVTQSVNNPAGANVVRTVVSLARAFNMTSVAEGVERQEELDLLWHIGCDQSQGYLHCKPLPAGEFAEVVQKGKGVLMQPPGPEVEGA